MCSKVNCEDYLCLGDDDTLGAVLYKLEGERGGGGFASINIRLSSRHTVNMSS